MIPDIKAPAGNKVSKFYVYGLYHNDVPFYIGKGSGKRAWNHKGIASRGSSLPVHKKIMSMESEPEIKILASGLTEKEAYSKEEHVISDIGRRCKGAGPLLNLADGGDGGTSGFVVNLTEEQIKKKNDALKSVDVRNRISEGVKNSNRVLTDKGRSILSAAHKGKVLSKETRTKISLSKKGKPGWEKTAKQKAAVSERNKGRTLSENTKKKISDAVKKTGMTMDQKKKQRESVLKKVECPHCGKVGARSIMLRWHFDNCKKRSI